MKILCTSDWHGDWVTHHVRRFDEVARAARMTCDHAIHNGIELFVFCGDLANPDSGPIVYDSLDLAIGIASDLADAKIPSVWISGNHDVIEEGRGTTTLTPMRDMNHHFVHVYETGTHECIETRSGNFVDIYALPYPSVTRPYDFTNVRVEQTTAVGLVVSHLSVPGVQPGEESHEMARGRDITYPFELADKALKARRGAMLQGHYHRRQSLKFGEHHMHIPGSLARLTFNEEHHDPSFLVIEV